MYLKEFLKIQSEDLPKDLKMELEYLVTETLIIDRLDYFKGSIELSSEQISILISKIADLKLGVPLAYILKSQHFMGLSFYVDSRVLIPRPETEFLVDLCLQATKTWVGLTEELKIFDAGAGSGCIGISLLVKRPLSKCVFLEKSEGAIEVLKINLENHKISKERYSIVRSFEEFEALESQGNPSLDIFISNPPYIAKGDENLEKSVVNYEPSMALFAEDEGLLFLKAWSVKALQFLKPASSFAIFEFGYGQQNALQSYANLMTMKSEIILDQYGVPRFWKIFGQAEV